MFIYNPDPYLLPSYRISPFTTESISRNRLISNDYTSRALEYFNERFGIDRWMLTINGREGISLAIDNLQLVKSDFVTIITPSNNLYISSCVTSQIEKHTNWNRTPNSQTKAYFVNHEFGYLYPNMEDLKRQNLPVIEDCCTTFFSQNKEKKIGKYGDFSIYSFPKFFSIQFGGLIVSNREKLSYYRGIKSSLSKSEEEYVLKVVGFELSQREEILQKRAFIFNYLKGKYASLGFTTRLPHSKGITPSVLLLNNNAVINNLQDHKEFLLKHGIQNSVFYGEDSFYVPCHQSLSIIDADYIFGATQQYIKL